MCRSQQIFDIFTTLSLEEKYLVLTLPAIGQSHVLQTDKGERHVRVRM